jgi:hypothetical protein
MVAESGDEKHAMENTKGNEVFDPTPFRNNLARKRTLHAIATTERAKLARDFLKPLSRKYGL